MHDPDATKTQEGSTTSRSRRRKHPPALDKGITHRTRPPIGGCGSSCRCGTTTTDGRSRSRLRDSSRCWRPWGRQPDTLQRLPLQAHLLHLVRRAGMHMLHLQQLLGHASSDMVAYTTAARPARPCCRLQLGCAYRSTPRRPSWAHVSPTFRRCGSRCRLHTSSAQSVVNRGYVHASCPRESDVVQPRAMIVRRNKWTIEHQVRRSKALHRVVTAAHCDPLPKEPSSVDPCLHQRWK